MVRTRYPNRRKKKKSETTDEITLPFRPRARLLQLLGDQLIGTPRLAVFELVKNAYDADARLVTVTLKNIGTESASITVKDDGDGMTLETIRDIWLVPAHDHRDLQRKARVRTRLHRLPLGEKGVGRFAVHKLGDHIKLVTRAQNQKECVVIIDWQALIGKTFLSDADVTVRTRTPKVFCGDETGTLIQISHLRETAWSRGEVRRLLRQVTSISSPFSKEFEVEQNEDGSPRLGEDGKPIRKIGSDGKEIVLLRPDRFEAVLEVPDHPDWVTGVPDIEALLDRAPWRFHFTFKDALLTWDYEFRGVTGIKLAPRSQNKQNEPLLTIPERDIDVFGTEQGLKSSKPKRVVADVGITEGIGAVSGEFYVFDRDREVLSRLGDSQLVQNFLDENGGVRVYRDSIRVYNYGEPGDDWLGLDLRRVNTPTRNISRNIVIGAIDLSLEHSDGLTEKTNREGFVENDAYRRLRQVVLGALGIFEIERKIDKDNIRALTGKGHDPETEQIKQPLQELRNIAKKHKISAEIDPLIDKAERNYNEMRDTMLRAGLSGMGLAVVFHEIEQGVRVLYNAIESGSKLESIQVQARELVRILDGFTELLRKGDRKQNSLKHLIRRARDINRVRFRNHKVKFECPALDEEFQDIERNFAFGLMLGALNNLLDNSFYWLQVRWPEGAPSERKIYISIDPDYAEGPAIIVADNGPGFQDDPERLTRPFFSRRPEGMGVGLYYANMVMELNGGRLAFPENGEVGVPEEFDGATIAMIFGGNRRK